jgi:hypothetical protein
VFASDATDLVPGVTSGKSEIYARDLGLGRTFLISQDNNGNPAPYAFTPSVSYDGRFVTFFSTGLVPNDTNGALHLYVRDTCFNVASCTPSTNLVDVATLGSNTGQSSLTGVLVSAYAISSTGRFVAFTSGSPDLAPIPRTYAHAFDNTGVYVRDMSCTSLSVCPNGGIHLVSLTGGGEFLGVEGGIDSVAISGDGHYVVYTLAAGKYQQAVLALTGF